MKHTKTIPFVKWHKKLLDLYVESREKTSLEEAESIIIAAQSLGNLIIATGDDNLLKAFRRYAMLIAIKLDKTKYSNILNINTLLPQINANGKPGISVVTCAMNRTENLLKALPTWLQFNQIKEIVIVDWSSREPVRAALNSSSFYDERIKVVRVNDEPRWILSYAFNVGFRLATYSTIMKLDADITLNADYFEKNMMPDENTFLAGNHAKAQKGQEHINGFVVATKEALSRVGGYNEYITRYGWDDDDLYHRLEGAGLKRIDVVSESLYHIPHPDSQRTDNLGTNGKVTAREALMATPRFLIHCNRNACAMLPTWGPETAQVPMILQTGDTLDMTLKRVACNHAVIPSDLLAKAAKATLRELLSWDFGPRVWGLSEAGLDAVLSRQVTSLSRLDIEVALVDPQRIQPSALGYLVLVPDADLLKTMHEGKNQALQRRFVEFIGFAKAKGFSCVIFEPAMGNIKNPPPINDCVVLGADGLLVGLERVALQELQSLKLQRDVWMSITSDELAKYKQIGHVASKQKGRIYVDVQHGLGNRLRAFSSAAAVAASTGRELVLIWVPDHHCECRFTDLYRYDGPVIEDRSKLPESNLRRYTYMELEPGAIKDQPIDLETTEDVLIRSAYVINHPASGWEVENSALRNLQPSDAVQALVDSVDISNCIGAHVRMEAGKGLDHNSYDSVENWSQSSHYAIQFWREKSHYSSFIKRIDALLQADPRKRLFLATDLPGNYEVFARHYGPKLRYLPRQVYDRSREQIIYALADAILLSRCSMLLGSTWSSFSELAMRLSTKNIQAEMSGKDF